MAMRKSSLSLEEDKRPAMCCGSTAGLKRQPSPDLTSYLRTLCSTFIFTRQQKDALSRTQSLNVKRLRHRINEFRSMWEWKWERYSNPCRNKYIIWAWLMPIKASMYNKSKPCPCKHCQVSHSAMHMPHYGDKTPPTHFPQSIY